MHRDLAISHATDPLSMGWGLASTGDHPPPLARRACGAAARVAPLTLGAGVMLAPAMGYALPRVMRWVHGWSVGPITEMTWMVGGNLLIPLVLAAPIGWVAARRVRALAGTSPDEARAAAAGAGMAATASSLAALAWFAASEGEAIAGLLFLPHALLAAGVIGAMAFGGLGARRKPAPAVYAASGVTALGAFASLATCFAAGGLVETGVRWMWNHLALYEALPWKLRSVVAIFAATPLCLAAVKPVARALKALAPQLSHRSAALGMSAMPLMAVCMVIERWLAGSYGMPTTTAAWLLPFLLTTVWATFRLARSAWGEDREALPA